MIRNPKRQFNDTFTGSVCISRCKWRPVPFESLLEMDWLLQKDAFSFDLESLEAQPCEIRYWFDGKHRVWIPDFGYRNRGPSRGTLVEVKPLQKLYPADPSERAWVHARFAAMRDATIARGYEFEVATENEIRVQPRLHNANRMVRSSGRHFPKELESAGFSAVLQLPHKATVKDLQSKLPSGIDAFDVALRLAWLGVITLDPRERWSRSTTFERSARSIS